MYTHINIDMKGHNYDQCDVYHLIFIGLTKVYKHIYIENVYMYLYNIINIYTRYLYYTIIYTFINTGTWKPLVSMGVGDRFCCHRMRPVRWVMNWLYMHIYIRKIYRRCIGYS